MNLILLTSCDFLANDQQVDGSAGLAASPAGEVCLRDRRALHIQTVLRAQVGDWVRVGLLNGNLGRARVVLLGSNEVTLEVETLTQPPPPTLPVTLLLALPRPRMLQRTLQTIATLGVQRLCLLQTARVEKSYWQTPLLQPEAILSQLYLGLEQARATQLPEVISYQRFRPFMEDVLPSLAKDTHNIIAHPGPYPMVAKVGAKNSLLAIGPEGGFIDSEVASFIEAGFDPIQMGERILRVETAVPVLLAKLF